MIHREVDEAHTRRGADRRPQCLVDEPARVLGRLCGGGEAGQRRDERHVVDLLQRAHAPARRRCPAAEHHQRRLVLLRGGHRAHPVGDARARGQRGHPGHPGHLRPALGGEGRGLLVAGVDQPEALVAAAVIDGKQVAAGQRENRVDAAGLQSPGDEPAGVDGLGGGSVGGHNRSLSTRFGYVRRRISVASPPERPRL